MNVILQSFFHSQPMLLFKRFTLSASSHFLNFKQTTFSNFSLKVSIVPSQHVHMGPRWGFTWATGHGLYMGWKHGKIVGPIWAQNSFVIRKKLSQYFIFRFIQSSFRTKLLKIKNYLIYFSFLVVQGQYASNIYLYFSVWLLSDTNIVG